MSSLVAQLIRASKDPERGPAMGFFKQCDNGTLRPSLDQLVDLVIGLIASLGICFVCINAPDECDYGTKEELLSILSKLSLTARNIKLLISTRSGEMDITKHIRQYSDIEMLPDLSESDITTYIKWRIRTGPERLRQIQSEDIIRKLIAGAEGM